MQFVKDMIRASLRRLGVEFFRTRPFGVDHYLDIRKIARGSSFDTIFDVGANAGQSALEFERKLPPATIYSFEPLPATFERLTCNVAGHSRVKPINAALGEAPGRHTLFLTQDSLTHSLLPTARQAKDYLGGMMDRSGEIQVQTSTLDDFVRQERIQHIDLLKLDVQGFELRVLRGAAQTLAARRISMLFAEVNFVPLYEGQAYFHEVYQHLLAQDFKVVGFYGLNYRHGPYLNWCDALFVNPSALQRRAAVAR